MSILSAKKKVGPISDKTIQKSIVSSQFTNIFRIAKAIPKVKLNVGQLIQFFCGFRVAHLFCVVLLYKCVFTLWVPCCDVRYDFHIKTIFCSSLPPVICRNAHVLFTLFVFLCVKWCPTHIVLCLCFIFLLLGQSKWTIQRNWQHRAQKRKKNTIRKQTQIT